MLIRIKPDCNFLLLFPIRWN